MGVFGFFEKLLQPTAPAADTTPPAGLLAFYWHYARQARGLVARPHSNAPAGGAASSSCRR